MQEIATHQNVKLAKGRHAGPEQGVCVMELASMLADEPFSDRPLSVCPTIAAYLRAVNDLVSDEERRLLFPYAAAVVGSAGNRADLRLRLRACAELVAREKGTSRFRARLLRWSASLDTVGALTARAALRFGVPYALTVADWLLELGEAPGVGLRGGRPQIEFIQQAGSYVGAEVGNPQ
jgi:hypothetical protein